jgi:hypothetical protein
LGSYGVNTDNSPVSITCYPLVALGTTAPVAALLHGDTTMPERRFFRGREVKNAQRIMSGTVPSIPLIKITFVGPKGRRGQQINVTPDEYDAEVSRQWAPGKTANV